MYYLKHGIWGPVVAELAVTFTIGTLRLSLPNLRGAAAEERESRPPSIIPGDPG